MSTFPSGGVIAVVVLSLFLHASWNTLAKAIKDKVVAFGLIAATEAACGGVVLAVARAPSGAAWAFLVASVGVHVVYDVALMNSYRFGDLAQTYPLARGLAPLLVAAGAFIGSGEAPTARQLLGLAVVCGGLVGLVKLGGGGGSDRRAIGFALLTGVAIALYTVVDGLGARRSGSPLGYGAALFLLQGVAFLAVLALARGRSIPRRMDGRWWLGCVGGLLSVSAYMMVLWAQTRAALVSVSALRETGVVVAAILGTVFLHEGHGRGRVAAAAVVAVGVALVVVA